MTGASFQESERVSDLRDAMPGGQGACWDCCTSTVPQMEATGEAPRSESGDTSFEYLTG